MDRRIAKEFLHIQNWLDRAAWIVEAGRDVYDADPLLREAGDSLVMKIGEAANRLSKLGVKAPESVSWADAIASRNWLIHQYDLIDRDITWATLERDLPVLRAALAESFELAAETVTARTQSDIADGQGTPAAPERW